MGADNQAGEVLHVFFVSKYKEKLNRNQINKSNHFLSIINSFKTVMLQKIQNISEMIQDNKNRYLSHFHGVEDFS